MDAAVAVSEWVSRGVVVVMLLVMLILSGGVVRGCGAWVGLSSEKWACGIHRGAACRGAGKCVGLAASAAGRAVSGEDQVDGRVGVVGGDGFAGDQEAEVQRAGESVEHEVDVGLFGELAACDASLDGAFSQ